MFRHLPYRKYPVFGLVVFLCLTLLTIQAQGRFDFRPVAELLARIQAPILEGFHHLQRATLNLWLGYLGWNAVRTENARLRDEVQSLKMTQIQTQELGAENERLRRLLTLKERLPLRATAADVIGKELTGWTRTLTINKGRKEGIARLMPVIASDGLVGRVMEVRKGTSVIQLLSDPSSSVSVLVQRSRVQGVVEGEASGGVRLRYLAKEIDVEVGDDVVTSGLGGVFPKGLPLGRVVELDRRPLGLFHFARLAPVVDLARIEEVLILLDTSPRDLARAMSEG